MTSDLADVRYSVGKPFGEHTQLFRFFFANLPAKNSSTIHSKIYTRNIIIIVNSFLTTHEAAWFIILVDSIHICTSGVSPGIMVEFVYEGHRVKVKVTGQKKVDNPPFFDL